MIRFRFAPLVLAMFALAACNKSGDTSAPQPSGPVKAVAPPAGTKWSDKIVATSEGVRMGNPDAALKLIEYGSYTCPHCRDFQSEAHEAIERDYVNSGKVSFEYRNMIRDPLDLTVAAIAHCAPADAFFALNTQFFVNQNAMIDAIKAKGEDAQKEASQAAPDQRFIKYAELANLIEFAKQRGLPEDKIRACLSDSKKIEAIANQSQAVLQKYPDFPGTPSFILNGTLLDSTASWDKLQPRLHNAGA